MDLIGEFHPPTRHGHHFALTACCMLTGFTWCIPLKTKTVDKVVTAYKNHIACQFGRSVKILIDNGTEFKNKLFKEVVAKLGTEMSIHSPPYRPQIPQSLHHKAHQPWIGMGRVDTNGNSMLQLLSQLQRLRISILPYVWKRSSQQTQPDAP